MTKRSSGWRIGLAAPAAVIAAGLGLAAPAQAHQTSAQQPSVQRTSHHQSLAGQTSPVTPVPAPKSNQSLQSLDNERPPAGTKRWVIDDPVAYAQAVKTGKWEKTPNGLSYDSCVYRAPNNAVVQTDKIISPSGSVQHITPCTHPMLTDGTSGTSAAEPGAGKAATGPVAPGSGPCGFAPGGRWWAASCYGTDPSWVGYMYNEYAVPSNPAQDGALVFIWGGLEDANGDTLLQDVLTWGANGNIVTNPNIWYVTNWYLWPDNNSVISSSMHVNPVDTIVATLNASNCDSAGDNCTWQLQSVDENSGKTVTLNVTATVAFDLLLGAVLEVPSGTGCIEMPANGHAAFRDLLVEGNNGQITPDFGLSTPDPQCSVSIKSTSNSADILWKT